MKTITLTQGFTTIVDEADYAELSKHPWHVLHGPYTQYARTYIKQCNGKWKGALMHRLLMKPKPSQLIDHTNSNGLDNRRSNLRFATRSQNGHSRPHRNKKYSRGIYFNKKARLWHSYIRWKGKSHFLCCARDKEDAAIHYQVASQILFDDDLIYLLKFP